MADRPHPSGDAADRLADRIPDRLSVDERDRARTARMDRGVVAEAGMSVAGAIVIAEADRLVRISTEEVGVKPRDQEQEREQQQQLQEVLVKAEGALAGALAGAGVVDVALQRQVVGGLGPAA